MAASLPPPRCDRPAADVFAYATDPTRFHEWQKGVVDGHMDEPGLPAVGARCSTTRRIGRQSRPRRRSRPHRRHPRPWGVRGIDGPIRATVDVTVEPLTDALAADHHRRLRGPRHRPYPVPLLVRREAEKDMPSNVAALKHRMEAVHE